MVNEINKDIVNLIKSNCLFEDSNILFLIGENSTGKSIIGEIISETTDIVVIDNFYGTYDDIPADKKVLIITHEWNRFIDKLSGFENFIVTQKNQLYGIVDSEILEHSYEKCYNWKNDFSKFLNIAVRKAWTPLVEKYYNAYLETIDTNSKCNQNLIKEIDFWKNTKNTHTTM